LKTLIFLPLIMPSVSRIASSTHSAFENWMYEYRRPVILSVLRVIYNRVYSKVPSLWFHSL
jgi:hypothetical protein